VLPDPTGGSHGEHPLQQREDILDSVPVASKSGAVVTNNLIRRASVGARQEARAQAQEGLFPYCRNLTESPAA